MSKGEAARESAPRDQESIAAEATGSETGSRVYTEAEVEQRLRGQAKELERLRQEATELASLKAEREELARKAAEEKGDFARLYESEKARTLALEQQSQQLRERLEAHERELAEDVRRQVAAVQSEAVRRELDALLDGRPIEDQRRILGVFLAGVSTAPQPPRQGGAPSAPQPASVDDKRFLSDREYRISQVREALRRARGA